MKITKEDSKWYNSHFSKPCDCDECQPFERSKGSPGNNVKPCGKALKLFTKFKREVRAAEKFSKDLNERAGMIRMTT